MSKPPGTPKVPIDPIIDFAQLAVAGLPSRKQRTLAVYYVRALQTRPERELSKLVPAHLYRPLRHSLVLMNLIGFIVFWRYPVAPPRMLGGFTDVVSSTHAFGNFHGGALASHANEVAAMPSLHMAWAAWCGLALWRLSSRRWVRVLALCYPCVTAFTVLATGNHFLLDLVAGLATLALALLALAAPGAIATAWRTSAPTRRRWRRSAARRRRQLGQARRKSLGELGSSASSQVRI